MLCLNFLDCHTLETLIDENYIRDFTVDLLTAFLYQTNALSFVDSVISPNIKFNPVLGKVSIRNRNALTSVYTE